MLLLCCKMQEYSVWNWETLFLRYAFRISEYWVGDMELLLLAMRESRSGKEERSDWMYKSSYANVSHFRILSWWYGILISFAMRKRMKVNAYIPDRDVHIPFAKCKDNRSVLTRYTKPSKRLSPQFRTLSWWHWILHFCNAVTIGNKHLYIRSECLFPWQSTGKISVWHGYAKEFLNNCFRISGNWVGEWDSSLLPRGL